MKADRVGDISAAMGPDGDRAAGRFARGCRCFAIEEAGRIVAYGWLSTSREWIGELSLWITPAAGEGYVWNCVTLPPYRRQGNYRLLLEGIVTLSRGLRRLWIGSIEDPAEKADTDAGFRPILQFSSTRIGPVRLLRATPVPGVAPRLSGEAMARLGLRRSASLAAAHTRIH